MRCVPIDHDSPTWCFECGVDTFEFEIGEFSYSGIYPVPPASLR
jgi:hypothetical protein